MKRLAGLFDQVHDRDTLRAAFHRVARGKADRAEVRRFAARLDENLDAAAARLRAGDYPFGRFTQFVIHDPKRRVITAPAFAERVVHHAVLIACEPAFDRWLVPDSFACRRGKGREAAVCRAREYAGRHRFFLKMDIRQFFDSVPHDRLLGRLARRFKEPRLLALFAAIVRGFRPGLGHGLPIGSLTSQHFANFYLGGFDRVVKEMWRLPGYVRYMDDMAVWADDRDRLRRVRADAAGWLRDELGLELKPTPYLNRTAAGMDFLGARVFPDRVTLNRRGRVRFRRRLAALGHALNAGAMTESEFQRRATALVAYATAAGVRSWRTRASALHRLGESVARLGPGEPGRELEQLGQELPVREPGQELAGEPEPQPGLPPRRSSAGRADA